MDKIDAVITWVDGSDPAHEAKLREYAPQDLLKKKDVAGSTRFSSIGEIFWCVASINRFAPWVNHIYIVTDNQNPGLDDFLRNNFPDGHIPYTIVDHKVIFNGYEQYLPTFNSISIETMTWRIPGLSDCFIEFNDDLLLSAPVEPKDFFDNDGNPVCYYKRYTFLRLKIKKIIKPKKYGHGNVTFKGTMANGAAVAGERFAFIRLDHTPHALRRDWYESFFTEHPEVMIRNIRYRFRDVDQFSSEVLQYSSLRRAKKCHKRSVLGNLFYLYPKKRPKHIMKKMKLLSVREYPYCCFNSLDMASSEDLELIRSWVSRRLRITLP